MPLDCSINSVPVIDVVRHALQSFIKQLEEKHKVTVTDATWTNAHTTCPCILKSGPRKDQACGKPFAKGKSTCAAHSRVSPKGTGPVSGGGAPVGSSTPIAENTMFRKSAAGNFVNRLGFVASADKSNGGVIGKEVEGKVVPLSDAEREVCVKNGIKIAVIQCDNKPIEVKSVDSKPIAKGVEEVVDEPDKIDEEDIEDEEVVISENEEEVEEGNGEDYEEISL